MITKQLKKLELECKKRKIPIIGQEKGDYISDKIKQLNPKTVLELGTANGYSGIILASQKAYLTTIDKDREILKEAEINFKKFGIKYRIIQGDALKEIQKLNNFDLIFIDHQKKQYLKILPECLKRTNHIIADNINFKECQDFKKEILKNKNLKTEIIKDSLVYITSSSLNF